MNAFARFVGVGLRFAPPSGATRQRIVLHSQLIGLGLSGLSGCYAGKRSPTVRQEKLVYTSKD
jgi:hypothetical protein